MTTSANQTGIHPLAPEHLPYFVPGADGSDPMFGNAVVFVVLLAFLGGVFYLYLHSLPERMAHGQGRTQFQIVALLALLALFTHESIFWIAALLLAATTLPDFLTPITSGARSLASLAGRDYADDLPEGEEDEADPDEKLQTQSQTEKG
ncbi:MAG: hypothetical protein ACWA5A_12725 [Marinibacterium sp.]